VPAFVGEVSRRKALHVVLAEATVTDKAGSVVDLTDFLKGTSQVANAAGEHAGHDHD
jgi:trigger factor